MSSTAEEVTFDSLVGEHVLSGIDYDHRRTKIWPDADHFEDCNVMSFTLDGVTYTAIEDPVDGYRSELGSFRKSDMPTTNQFPGVRVVASLREKTEYGNEARVLKPTDVVTSKTVLEVGTDANDDYYPCFVACHWPENMAINQGKEHA